MLIAQKSSERVAKYADMFSAIGTEPRLRIMQLLLSAHPDGLVVSEIQEALRFQTPPYRTIWTSSGTKDWSGWGGRARSYGTQPILVHFKNYCSSCMRNVVR